MVPSEMSQDKAHAYHEAGHAVAFLALGRKFVDVSIGYDRQERSYGRIRPTNHAWPLENYEPGLPFYEAAAVPAALEVVLLLAGGIAERIETDGPYHQPHFNDWCNANYTHVQMQWRSGGRPSWDLLELRTEELVRAHWGAVKLLAEALLARRTLTAEVAASITASAMAADSWSEVCDRAAERDRRGERPRWFVMQEAVRLNMLAPKSEEL